MAAEAAEAAEAGPASAVRLGRAGVRCRVALAHRALVDHRVLLVFGEDLIDRTGTSDVVALHAVDAELLE